jgi:hypothetical protein
MYRDQAIDYINQLLSETYDLIEDRKLDPDYGQDQDLKEFTESEQDEIVNAQKFMDYIIEEDN